LALFSWEKMGRLDPPLPTGFSEGRAPCALPLGGGRLALAFTALDAARKSHVFVCPARLAEGGIRLEGEPRLALSPGELGQFDEDGAMTSCLTPRPGGFYLFYTGWQLLRSGAFAFGCGRALFDSDTLEVRREFPGPVLAKDPTNPLLCASPYVLQSNGQWVMWYVSGLRWERREDHLFHYYTIRRAVSADALRWESDPEPCIALREHEYAIARPCVLQLDGLWHMWFSHRGFTGNTTYRIGYADSIDGLHWRRHDAEPTLELSAEGWDSEMVCYPAVFAHEDRLYMLYNGNGFGKSGFGYAVAKR